MNDWPIQTRAAQMQKSYAAARAQDAAHGALQELPFGVMINAVLAHIQARPDATADEVAVLGKALNALAWEMEREE
jgi:hypothetical protein